MPQFSAFNVSCRFFSGDERRCVLRFDAMRRVVQVVVDEKPCPETFYAGKLLCAFPSVGYACALFAHFRDGSAPFHIHCATERERDLLVQALNGARDGDYSALDGLENGMILCDPVRLPGRLTSTSREAVLVSSRLLLYRNSVATLPLLVLSLEEAELDTPKPDTLSVRQGGMRVAVRFSDTATADKWLAAITKVVKEVRSAHVAAKAERRRQAVEARRSSAHRASAAAADAVGVDVGGERSGAATATSSDARPATGPASGGGGGGGGRGVSFADIVRQAQNRGTLLTAWGGNESGQLGGGARSQQCASSPTVVRALRNSNAPDAIAAGARHCMAVTKQGAAFAWGAGTDGQLGLGSNCRQSTRPFLISSFRGITVRHVACGRAHSLALADGGAVWGWGSNAAGQLGTGATSGSLWIPRRLNATSDAGFPDVRALAAGGDASAALAVDGAVFAWGAGRYGQVGSGSSENALSPKRVRGCGDKQFAQVVLGATFALAVSIDGRVWQWGRMGRAEKPQEGGQGEEEDEEDEDEDDASAWASPIEVAGLDGPIRAVSAGTAHAVALGGADSSVAAAPLSASEWFDRAKSVMASPVETEVYQWGPSAAPPTPPTAERVEALCGKQVVAVAAGDGFSVAVTRSGGLFAWGKLGSGQAGNGSFDTVPLPPDTPTIVEPEPGMQLSPLLACCGQAVMAIAIKTSALQQPAGNALATKLAAKWRERAAAGRSRGDGDNDNHQGEAVEAPLSRAAPSDTSPPPPPPPPPAVTASAGAASASAGRISSDFDLPPPPPPPPPPSSGAKAKADRSTAAEGSEAEHDGEPMPPTSSQPPLKGAVPQAAASGAARTERGSDGSEPPPPPPPELESPPYMG